MRRFILLALCIAATAAVADPVARRGDDSVRITDKPCSNEGVLGRLPPELKPEYADAVATVAGQLYRPCWRPMGNAAHLLYDDGDQGLVPLADFKDEPGA